MGAIGPDGEISGRQTVRMSSDPGHKPLLSYPGRPCCIVTEVIICVVRPEAAELATAGGWAKGE